MTQFHEHFQVPQSHFGGASCGKKHEESWTVRVESDDPVAASIGLNRGMVKFF